MDILIQQLKQRVIPEIARRPSLLEAEQSQGFGYKFGLSLVDGALVFLANRDRANPFSKATTSASR